MAPRPVTPQPTAVKRSAPDDDDDVEPAAKRVKTNGAMWSPSGLITTPSKKRKLEEDGLILLEDATEKLDDDVIVIE